MSNNNDVEVKVGAESSGVKTGMTAAADAVKEGVEQMKGSLEGLGGTLETVMKHLNAFAAILAGGAIFKAGISATKALTAETVSLSKQLGISMEDASQLNVALKSIGSSAGTYTDANAKLTRQIRTNEESVNAMGVATRGANGQLLDGKTIMNNAITALKSYKEGTDRNLAGQQLFGRGAQDVAVLMKLNNKIMEEAKEKAESLGLVIGPEQAAKTKAYKESLEEVGLVLEGMENQIGQAVMPILTSLGEWFASIGPGMVQTFKVAMDTLADVFDMVRDVARELWADVTEVFQALGSLITAVAGTDIPSNMEIWRNAMAIVRVAALGLKEGIELVFEAVRAAILIAISEVERWAAVAKAAFHMDWDGAAAAFQGGVGRIEKILADSQARILKGAADTSAQMQRALMGEAISQGKPVSAAATPKGGRAYIDPKQGKGGKDSDELKAQFALLRATLEGELAVQQEYLKESQEAYDYAYKNNLMSTEDYYSKKLSNEEAALSASIRIKQEEIRQTQALEAQATKQSDKLGLKAQEVKLTAQLTVLNAQAANAEIKNTREVTTALRQKANALAEIARVSAQQAGKSGVDMDKIQTGKALALRQITQEQALQQEKAFEDRMFAINLAAEKAKLALINNDPIKRAEINANIEQLERDHQVSMAAIDKDIAVESQKNIIAAQDAIESSFSQTLGSILSGTQTLKQGFKSLFDSIMKSLADLAAQQVSKSMFSAITGAVGQGGNSTGWLGSLLGAVASYDVGTSYVPSDGLAMIHKGERVVTAKDNANGKYGGGGGTTVMNFSTPSVPDRRSQQQIAMLAMQGAMTAQRRNG